MKTYSSIPVELLALCESPYEYGVMATAAMIYEDYGAIPLTCKDWAALSMMSTGKVSQTLAALVKKGLLHAQVALPVSEIESGRQDGCSYCGIQYPLLHQHHIVARSAGGSDRPGNIAWPCPNCHALAHATIYIPYWEEANPNG